MPTVMRWGYLRNDLFGAKSIAKGYSAGLLHLQPRMSKLQTGDGKGYNRRSWGPSEMHRALPKSASPDPDRPALSS